MILISLFFLKLDTNFWHVFKINIIVLQIVKLIKISGHTVKLTNGKKGLRKTD